MLTLILGRAGSGKTAAAMEQIRRRGETGGKSLFVVPEQYSHDAERQLCRACGDGASLYTEVVSFSRLCSRVFSGGDTQVLDQGGRVLLMNRAINRIAAQLRVFGALGSKVPFLEGLLQIYDELRTSCVDFDALYRAAEGIQGPSSDKIRDMALIFTVYEGLIPENTADPRSLLTTLAQHLHETGIDKEYAIYLDGFTDFTPQQLEVICGFFKLGCPITACLTCGGLNGTEPQFELTRKTAAQLLSLAESRGEPSEILYRTGDGRNRPPELLFAERNIMEHTPADYSGECGAVEVYRAKNVREECVLAAGKIGTLIRRHGYRYREIAVTARNWERYSPVAESLFEKYGIPVMHIRKEDLLEKPVLALVTSALDIIANDWTYGDVFRFLKTGLTGLLPAERDILENYVLKWNIRGVTRWRQEEPWNRNPRGYTEEITPEDAALLQTVDTLRRQVAAPLIQLQRQMKQAENGKQMAQALYDFVTGIQMPKQLQQKADRFRRSGQSQTAEEYTRLWEILIRSLEQYAAIAGEETCTPVDFAALFKLVLSQYQVGTIPAAADSVGIGDMTRMKRRDIRCLIVLGAGDDSIPDLKERGGILSDEERDLISGLGIGLADTPDSRLHREMNLYYTSFTLPSDRLVVSYSTGTDSGIGPSFLVQRLLQMFRLTEKPVTDEWFLSSRLPCFELAVSRRESPYAAAARSYFAGEPEWNQRMQAIQRALSVPRERLTQVSAQRLYGKKLRLSSSRMDQFQSCRFAYFLTYGLQLKKRRPAGFEAPEAGTFMHFVLEHTANEVMAQGGFSQVPPSECRTIARKYVNQYVKTVLGGLEDKTERFKYLFRRLIGDVEQVVLTMADELSRSDFVPLDFELSFSENGEMPPYRLKQGELDIAVNGKVDRVDGWIHDGKLYLRVVDYKTGKKSFQLSDVQQGLGLQMLLYLFVLEKWGQKRYGLETVPAGVLYVPARDAMVQVPPGAAEDTVASLRQKTVTRSGLLLRDPEVLEAMEHGEHPRYLPVKFTKNHQPAEDHLASLAQLGALARHVDETLLQMGQEIQNGEIGADPYYRSEQDNACLWCDYYEACHFEEGQGGNHRRYVSRIEPKQFWDKMDKGGGR